MAEQKVLKRLFIMVMLVMASPLLNYCLNIIESGPLEGVATPRTTVRLSPDTWWDGSFQQYANDYMNDSIGLRPDLVRMTNQLDFSLFNRVNAEKVILGKDGHLYARMYINEYNAINTVSDTAIIRLCKQLQRIQDTMNKQGKTFIIALTPSKPYVYPAQLPYEWKRRTNTRPAFYPRFRHYGDSLQLRFLDYNAWFAAMQPTATFPLMPKTGVHWSCYASVLAADSLVSFVERERHIRMTHILMPRVKITDTPRAPDNDVGNIMNLIYPLTKEKLLYPDLEYDSAGSTTPKAVYVGDSFMWLWLQYNIPGHINSDWEFWEHFSNVWRLKTITGQEQSIAIKDYNWKSSVDKADYIVLMYNPANYHEYFLPDNFVQQLYQYYFSHKL